MISRNKVLVICLTAVLLVAAVCGLIIWRTWRDVSQDMEDRRQEAAIEEEREEEREKDREKDRNKEKDKESVGDSSDDIREETGSESEGSLGLEEDTAPLVSLDMLVISKDPAMYTYEDMKSDLDIIASLYPDFVQVDSLGQTMDGREIYHLTIGDKGANTKIFINGGIHAREYITSQLVMKQTTDFLQHLQNNDSYAGKTYVELLNDTVIHVVPMINPDGIAISQFGMDGIIHEEVKNRVREIAVLDGASPEGSYLTRWKANANGVDINRNFDALWESYAGAGHPSCDHYKGESIGCEPESAALIRLTQQEMFDRTISYHTQGNVIYWYFGQSGELYEETLDFANCISGLTGYPTDANYEYLDPAGYKDWGTDKLGIVGLTVEIGTETSPVPPAQFAGIWAQNQYVWEETIKNVKGI